jgi:homoserine dehydrogenase
MADQNISLESIVQRRPVGLKAEPETANVILITYATTEEAVRRAIAAIEAEGVVASLPQVIRMEKD